METKRSQIMKSAWRMFRQMQTITFSRALVLAWEIQKEIEFEEAQMTKLINNIKNKLSLVNIMGTKKRVSLMNKNKNNPEVLEMLEEGVAPLATLFNERRRISARYNFRDKIFKTKRPRIIPQNTITVNLEDYAV